MFLHFYAALLKKKNNDKDIAWFYEITYQS